MDGAITYQLENAQQFWAEVDDILGRGKQNEEVAKACLDVYVSFVSSFQDEYLESKSDFAVCCYKLLDSRMYELYQESIVKRIINRAAKRDDLKELWVTYHLLLFAGKENLDIFRLIRRKRKFFKKLRQHIFELEGHKIQEIATKLLFEICRVQRLSEYDLCIIDEPFLNYLFDLVEKTRDDDYEAFNYSVIKLILSFNEQFMANMFSGKGESTVDDRHDGDDDGLKNIVLRVLGARIGTSKTFGENVIFMLNRCVEPHIQMLILKLLYQIFTTPQTFEYFYTNDLMVLVDVFIRELYNLPDESEALQHTYLRVLHPLLANTQLCRLRYKQHQIYSLLSDLIGTNVKQFKPVSPTTRRLVERCLLVEYLNGIVSRSDEVKTVVSVENGSSGGATGGDNGIVSRGVVVGGA